MKNYRPLLALAAFLALALSCGEDKGLNVPDKDQAIPGHYNGVYLYSQYQHGNQMKLLSQTVEVIFDDTLFRMRKDPDYPQEPRDVCDISAPYETGSTITINCPDLQLDCPEWEHPCGAFTRVWKGDSLKLSLTYTDASTGWVHYKRLDMKKVP